MSKRSTVARRVKITRLDYAGLKKDETIVTVTHSGPDWRVARFRFDGRKFGIPQRFNTVELHLFKHRTVAVWQFIDKKNRAFRNYYNISEPVLFGARAISSRDLELDVVRDASSLRILDESQFRNAPLSGVQLRTVERSLMLILRGDVDAWCSGTGAPLREFAGRGRERGN